MTAFSKKDSERIPRARTSIMPSSPDIDDEQLVFMANTIRPVMRCEFVDDKPVQAPEGELYYIQYKRQPGDRLYIEYLRDNLFMIDPHVWERAEGLHTLSEVPMRFDSGSSTMLNATIADVMKQIPIEFWDLTKAFELRHEPDLWRQKEGFGYYVVKTMLYRSS